MFWTKEQRAQNGWPEVTECSKYSRLQALEKDGPDGYEESVHNPNQPKQNDVDRKQRLALRAEWERLKLKDQGISCEAYVKEHAVIRERESSDEEGVYDLF